MRRTERVLESIIRQAENLRPSIDDDEQMYYLVGGIIVNAEDALGALRSEHEMRKLDAMFGALASGNVTVNGKRV